MATNEKTKRSQANLSDPDDGRPVKISLTLDRELLNKALAVAAMHRTSLSGLFVIMFQETASKHKEQIAEYEALKQKLDEITIQ